jgi:membrane protein involved in colicin uptake
MAQYKLKALNVHIGGVLYKIEDKKVFDTKKSPIFKKEIEDAAKAGFLVELKGSAEADAKAKAKAKEEAEAEAEAEVKAKEEADAKAKANKGK